MEISSWNSAARGSQKVLPPAQPLLHTCKAVPAATPLGRVPHASLPSSLLLPASGMTQSSPHLSHVDVCLSPLHRALQRPPSPFDPHLQHTRWLLKTWKLICLFGGEEPQRQVQTPRALWGLCPVSQHGPVMEVFALQSEYVVNFHEPVLVCTSKHPHTLHSSQGRVLAW